MYTKTCFFTFVHSCNGSNDSNEMLHINSLGGPAGPDDITEMAHKLVQGFARVRSKILPISDLASDKTDIAYWLM